MHRLSTSFLLGYHGCDKTVAEGLLDGGEFKKSENDYDWLGPGVYFWEANPARAVAFAKQLQSRKNSSVKSPAAIGAVIDLGFCLDLATEDGLVEVQRAYQSLKKVHDRAQQELPRNQSPQGRQEPDLLLRYRDCSVINGLHTMRQSANLPPFDTVRGVFIEGDPLYETSGFHRKTHVQICVCNPAAIKGVFRLPKA